MQKAPRHTTTITSVDTPQHTRTPRYTAALKWRRLPSPFYRLHLGKVPGQRTKQQPQSCMHLHSVGNDALAVESQTYPVQPECWPQMRQVPRGVQQGQQHKANSIEECFVSVSTAAQATAQARHPRHTEAVAFVSRLLPKPNQCSSGLSTLPGLNSCAGT